MKPIRDLTLSARNAGFTGGGYVPTGGIEWLLGRIHVGTSPLAVARQFWHVRAAKYPRPLKRAIVRVALRVHAENRGLYRAVVSGRF